MKVSSSCSARAPLRHYVLSPASVQLRTVGVELRAVGVEIRVNTSVSGYEFTLPGPDHYYMRLPGNLSG